MFKKIKQFFGSDLGSTVTSGLGGWIQNRQAKKEAQRNRSFQERMSSTAHQREVSDLRKAGLNPILSVNKGASTPSGSMAQIGNVGSQAVDAGVRSKQVNTARMIANKQIGLLDAQINDVNSAREEKNARTNLINQQVEKQKAEAQFYKDNPEFYKYEKYVSMGSQVLSNAFQGMNLWNLITPPGNDSDENDENKGGESKKKRKLQSLVPKM